MRVENMNSIVDLLKAPEELSYHDKKEYVLALIFANRQFFDFKRADSNIIVKIKGTDTVVFDDKYFDENEPNMYQMMVLENPDEEFDLEIPVRANLGDTVFVAQPKYSLENDMLFSVDDIKQVVVTGYSGASDITMCLRGRDIDGNDVSISQEACFLKLSDAIAFVSDMNKSKNTIKDWYKLGNDMKQMLDNKELYPYRIESKYRFNQLIDETVYDSRKGYNFDKDVKFKVSRFVISLGHKTFSSEIQLSGSWYKEDTRTFYKFDEKEWAEISEWRHCASTYRVAGVDNLSRLSPNMSIDDCEIYIKKVV